jgi:hypothetical protein
MERTVANRFRSELGLVVGWILFPLIPVVLEDIYYSISNLNFIAAASAGPDPYDWSWLIWVIMLGPLVGYGFLAGATVRVPDEPAQPRRWFRSLLARRAVWVAMGPWWGALVCIGLFIGLSYVERLLPAVPGGNAPLSKPWEGTWTLTILSWFFGSLVVGIWAFSWLWPAWAALRRAARRGEWKRSLIHGVMMAGAFVGSLFGSFWAATAMWRSYFFDSRVVQLLLLAVSLAIMSGCAGTITYGEMRRRELFHAMLAAWVLGLALMWRWWSRPRRV